MTATPCSRAVSGSRRSLGDVAAARPLPGVLGNGIVLLVVVAALLAEGCRSRPQPPLRCCHVVLINVDTLRADHLGAYGYARNTSPAIDRFAREGAVFSQALAASSYTRESVSALFTGRYPSCAGAVGWDAHPSPESPSLAEAFRRAGYFTAFLSLTTMLSHPQFHRGFEQVQELASAWGVSRAGPLLARQALEVWRRVPAGKKRFFYLHFLDPHGPYDPPPEVLARFAPPLSEQVLDLYRDVRPRLPELVAQGFGPRDARFGELVRRYDAEIAHTDEAVGWFLEELAKQGDLANTLVVLTADHGEEFLEHGFVEHAWTLYQEVLHVPLIVWRPGLVPAGRYPGWVSGVDLAPTLLALLGVAEEQRFDGEPLLRPVSAVASLTVDVPERPVYAELWIGERNVARSVVKGAWKYSAAARWLEPSDRPAAAARENELRQQAGGGAVPPWEHIAREELFRLSSDPKEQHNLLARAPQVAEEMRAELARFAQRCAPARAPARTLSPEEAERMRVLGY